MNWEILNILIYGFFAYGLGLLVGYFIWGSGKGDKK